MFKRDSIRVVEPGDDEAPSFEDSNLPILQRDGGWTLSYPDPQGHIQDHLVTGTIGDVDLAVELARAYLDRAPRTTAWPHSGSVVGDEKP